MHAFCFEHKLYEDVTVDLMNSTSDSDICIAGNALEFFGIKDCKDAVHTLSILRKRYYELSLLCHPDRGGSKDDMIVLQKLYHTARAGLEHNKLSEDQLEELMSRSVVFDFRDIETECQYCTIEGNGSIEGQSGPGLNHEEFMLAVDNDTSYVGCMVKGAPPPLPEDIDAPEGSDSEIVSKSMFVKTEDSVNNNHQIIDFRPLDHKNLMLNYEEHKNELDDYGIDAPLIMADICNTFVTKAPSLSDTAIQERTLEGIIMQRENDDNTFTHAVNEIFQQAAAT